MVGGFEKGDSRESEDLQQIRQSDRSVTKPLEPNIPIGRPGLSQRWARSASKPRPVLVVVIAGLLTAAMLTASSAGSSAASSDPSPGTHYGLGFDARRAPASDLMAAWLGTSPYRAVGIYIGGVNRSDEVQPQLTPAWVSICLLYTSP